MKKLYILFLTLFILLTFTFLSCVKQDRNADLINKAYNITESDPQQGLLFLDSISDPSNMQQDLYMRYIVIHNQARQKSNQDISKDSLIFEAERYFAGDDDLNVSALAHSCAGRTHYDADRKDKALFSFSRAAKQAILSGNNLMAGRSKNNIAYIYFTENIMDSTITNAKKALAYFEKGDEYQIERMNVIVLIGRAYEDKNSLDSAYSYFDRGLQLAKANNNLPMQAIFNHNIGLVMLDKNRLDESVGYFHIALHQTLVAQDFLKSNMLLSRVYVQKNLMDSARFYMKRIDNRIAEIHDNHTKKDMYEILSKYMQGKGDYEEANRYLNLQYSYKCKIFESNISAKLIETENMLRISKNEKDNNSLLSKILISFLLLLITLLIVGFVIYRKYNKVQQKNELENSAMNFEKEKKKFSDKIKKYQESEKQIKEESATDKRIVLVDSYLSINRLHKELNEEWRQIDKRLASFMATEYIDVKPHFQKYMDDLLTNLQEKKDGKLYELAKDCLKNVTRGGEIIPNLEPNELIILVLSNSKYSDEVIGETLDIKAQFIITQRIELKYKLQKLGFTEEVIREILFPDFKTKKSR